MQQSLDCSDCSKGSEESELQSLTLHYLLDTLLQSDGLAVQTLHQEAGNHREGIFTEIIFM